MKKCPDLSRCGGCVSVGKPYPEVLKEKENAVRKLFAKENVRPIIGMEDPYYYRHKVYGTFYKDRKGKIHSGMYAENTHRLTDNTRCLIQHRSANAVLKSIADIAERYGITVYNEDTREGVLRHAYIRVSHDTGDILLVLVIGSKSLPSSKAIVRELISQHPQIRTVILNHNREKTSMILGEKEDVLYGKGYITDRIGNTVFRISSRSFYQVNPVMTEKLYQTAIGLADLRKDDSVLDVYCGIGTISLLAAEKCGHVTGVELNRTAVRDAVQNARNNMIKNVSFYAEDAELFMMKMQETPDVVFLDPPRSGLSLKTVQSLCTLHPKKIIYISCNPETQKRDIEQMKKAGYRAKVIIPVDQFPFTKHIETIVLLQKLNS